MAYHRQGRARPASVLEFLDTHLEAKRETVTLRENRENRGEDLEIRTSLADVEICKEMMHESEIDTASILQLATGYYFEIITKIDLL